MLRWLDDKNCAINLKNIRKPEALTCDRQINKSVKTSNQNFLKEEKAVIW